MKLREATFCECTLQLQLRRKVTKQKRSGRSSVRSFIFDSRHFVHIYISFSALDSTFASYLFKKFIFSQWELLRKQSTVICISLMPTWSLTVRSIMIYKQDRGLRIFNEVDKMEDRAKLWSMEAKFSLKLIPNWYSEMASCKHLCITSQVKGRMICLWDSGDCERTCSGNSHRNNFKF